MGSEPLTIGLYTVGMDLVDDYSVGTGLWLVGTDPAG